MWSVYNALALTATSCAVLLFNNLYVLLPVFSISIAVLIFLNRKLLLYSMPVFGIANSITLTRFLIITCSFLLIDLDNAQTLFCLLLVAVLLDFFDGKAARHFKESSFFGQYFDMEIDAFFVLLMCFYYYLCYDISCWILIPALLRYLFRLYTFLFPRMNFVERKKKYATFVAASYFAVLLIGLITSGSLQLLVLMIGSLAVMLSFFIGIVEYYRL